MIRAPFMVSNAFKFSREREGERENQCSSHLIEFKQKQEMKKSLPTEQMKCHQIQKSHFSRKHMEKAFTIRHKCVLIWCGSALVQLREPHSNTHRVLQELLSTSANARLFLLIERFAPKWVYAICEASFHQCIIHPQAAVAKTNKVLLSFTDA